MNDKLSGLSGLDQRSRDIFQRLVETYLSEGEPVGSRTLSRSLPINLSPASVRNVMADLEETGLIFSPHTSAGRLPTELGLRFFVDALMEFGPLSDHEQAEIENKVKAFKHEQRVEDVLTEATHLLSGLSQCAGVVVAPKMNMRLKHVEFVHLGDNKALVILVGEDGSVENRAIDLPAGLPGSVLTQAANYLNARLKGKTLDQVQSSVKNEAENLRRELDELTAKIVETGLAVWSGDSGDEHKTLIVRGQANLIDDHATLGDLERIRRLFDDLETKNELTRLLGLAEEGEGVRIFIGSENKLFSLSGSSLIVSPYRDSEEKIVGVLGIIGPTRLNYARIIPMVDYTAKILGRMLS